MMETDTYIPENGGFQISSPEWKLLKTDVRSDYFGWSFTTTLTPCAIDRETAKFSSSRRSENACFLFFYASKDDAQTSENKIASLVIVSVPARSLTLLHHSRESFGIG